MLEMLLAILSLMSATPSLVNIQSFLKILKFLNCLIKWAPEIKIDVAEAGWITDQGLWIKCNIHNHRVIQE